MEEETAQPHQNKHLHQHYIDKITLECMMNRHHYKQYLSKTHQTVDDAGAELEHNLGFYEEKLKESLLDLIHRQNLDNYSFETHELFEKLVNKLVRQYENIESISQEGGERTGGSEDEDANEKCDREEGEEGEEEDDDFIE